MTPIISVSNLSKTYASGFQALKNINLEIRRTGISALLKDLSTAGIVFTDLNTMQSSLEDIFVDLVRKSK